MDAGSLPAVIHSYIPTRSMEGSGMVDGSGADVEMSSRYKYVKGLADSAQERAKGFHKEYQEWDDLINRAERFGDTALVLYLTMRANSKLNDFFYWIGHANAYRGIALQVDFMETVEEEMDAEGSCP